MIGPNIRKLREKKNISQDRLSKLSNLALNTIVKIESGRNPNPTIKTLFKIANSLSVKVDDLLSVVIFVLFFFGFGLSFAYCQQLKTGVEITLNLEEAISAAYKNNKDIQIQETELEAAKAGITEARSEFLPQLNLNAGYTHNGAVSPVSVSGKKDRGVFTGYINDNTVGAGVSQIVYNGGSNVANYNTSKINLRIQEETLRAKKLDVEFETKRLYYGLLLAYETERIAQDLVDNAKDHYEDVKNRFNQGTSSKFDLLQSKVQVALLMPQLIKAKNAVDLITAELKKLLGYKQEYVLRLSDKRLEYSFIEINEEEFLKIAYLNKPEMILKALGVDITKWSIEMAKSGWRPQVNANLGYDYRSNDVGDMLNKEHNNWSAGISVSLAIFDGFATKAKVDAAKARYQGAILTKENVADQIAVDVKQACLDLEQAEEIIYSQEDNVYEAEEALRISVVSYDNGEAKNLDVLDATVSLGQVEQNLSQGIYDYLMAHAELDRTLGRSVMKEKVEK